MCAYEMLLKLLEHREELFAAVLGRFIEARDCHSLGALSGTNWRLYAAVWALPWWQHCRKLLPILTSIRNINILYNKYISIRDYNNKLSIYSCWESMRQTSVRTHRYTNYIIYYVYQYPSMGEYIITHYNTHVNIAFRVAENYISIHIDGKVPEWINKYNIYVNIDYTTSGYYFDCQNGD
jgi:hypothetical protein